MLLREAASDPLLSAYSALIVDEAHERSLASDVVLALLKSAQARRRSANGGGAGPLKLVVMSATLEVDTFCAFFDGAPAVQVLGRSHPVEVLHAAEPCEDYLEAVVTTVLQIHQLEPAGDVLVFLTGEDDISAAAAAIEARARLLPATSPTLLPLPLYAALSPAAQMEALAPAPPKTRKAVLATNIAETSLTIEGVVYVVDSGLAKSKAYHAARRVDSLLQLPISRAAALQRAGRAGRVSAGKCFRLYTERTFEDDLEEATAPEVLRRSLSATVLSLLSLGVKDVLSFEFLTPPPADALAAALEELLALRALDNSGALTADGRLLARLPLEPIHGRALLAARGGRVLGPMLSLLGVLCADGALFHSPHSHREAADESRLRFRSPGGDTLTALHVVSAYDAASGGGKARGEGRRWAEANFLNWRTLETAVQVRTQLVATARRLGLGDGDGRVPDGVASAAQPLSSEESVELRRALAAAFFLQAAVRRPSGDYVTLVSRQTVSIHPSSALFSRRAPCVLYNELVFTTRLYMRDLTTIEAAWLAEVAPHFFKSGAAAAATGAAPSAGQPRMRIHGGGSFR